MRFVIPALVAVLLAVPAPAMAAGDDITVSPERAGPGDTVRITLACTVFTGAFAESAAFGKVAIPGEQGATVRAAPNPGRYAVHARCARDANPLNDAWLTVENAYPAGGAGTGGGAMFTRAVSPVVSIALGVLAVAGMLLLVLRPRRPRSRR
ncbi:hypothetical protein OIE66_01320 [Nonomuraea sp. NBC_01738]|uniref:hypothetical protein n=1 Tax=Nonomuraea sp. NBC_01738 TaxID=2976003 RepID=UPI002E1676CF|nr:hypothetical protein OIE66_01320 [Nonomuraea sp. NBC_01738]